MGSKRGNKRPWWETGLGQFTDAEREQLRIKADAIEAQSKESARRREYRHMTALSEYFNDGAPSSWEFAIVIVGIDPEAGEVRRLDIVGPTEAPPYSGMSRRFVESIGDYARYAREFHAPPTSRFVLSRSWDGANVWNVLVNPGERYVREVMNRLGLTDWNPSTDEFLGAPG